MSARNETRRMQRHAAYVKRIEKLNKQRYVCPTIETWRDYPEQSLTTSQEVRCRRCHEPAMRVWAVPHPNTWKYVRACTCCPTNLERLISRVYK